MAGIAREPVVKEVDATPSKGIYHSIIPDYTLERAVCELVDNVLDQWTNAGRKSKISIDLDVDEERQTIRIADNAGGVPGSRLSILVGPGVSGNDQDDPTIGIFGVGTKRAMVALASDVRITTRYADGVTNRIRLDDEWLDKETWILPVNQVDALPEGSTVIELTSLRMRVEEARLRVHLGRTYALFLQNRLVTINLNRVPVGGSLFKDWAYPPGYEARCYVGTLPGTDVKVQAEGGLATKSSPTGEYGVSFYCNDRLVASNLRTTEVGFFAGVAGLPHPGVSLVHLVVRLTGAAAAMPWNSSKSDLNYNHPTFQALQPWIFNVMKDWASLSRGWQRGDWPAKVFAYPEGKMVEIQVEDFKKPRSTYLPKRPKFKPRRHEKVLKNHDALFKDKPWLRGTVEGFLAAGLARNFTLRTANRVALIILDSTVEIAFKHFLCYESGQHYPDAKLHEMFQRRDLVVKEVRKHHPMIPEGLWKKLRYYYDLRCKLVHERADAEVSDGDLDDYEVTAATVIKDLLGVDPTEDSTE